MKKAIPHFSRYLLDESGKLTRVDGSEVSMYINDSGYYCARIEHDDDGFKLVRVHRLVALTFKEVIEDWLTRLVNHKDGNKLNITASNLEWSSYLDNNQHAYANGLNKNGVALKAYDALNKQEYSFLNIVLASGVINLPHGVLRNILYKGSCTPCKTWWFKAPDDERLWDEVMEEPSVIPNIKRYLRYENGIVCHDYRTGISHIVENVNQAVKLTKLNKTPIVQRLESNNYAPCKGWGFKFIDDATVFKTMTVEELEFAEKNKGNTKEITLVNSKTAEEKTFPSWYEFARFLGMEPARTSNIIARIKKVGSFRDWHVKTVEVKPRKLLEVPKDQIATA